MNGLRFSGKIILFLCMLQGIWSCKERTLDKSNVNNPEERQTFNLKIGKVVVQSEFVIYEKERNKGLMFRDSMELNEGMFFVFEKPSRQTFWMKNTRIPLDIGYFSSSGQLLEVHGAQPFDLSGIHSLSKDIKFVLELNLGAFRKLGIRIGDYLDLKQVAEFISKRGGNPANYKLPTPYR